MVLEPELQSLRWKVSTKFLLAPTSHVIETQDQRACDMPILIQFPDSQSSHLSNICLDSQSKSQNEIPYNAIMF